MEEITSGERSERPNNEVCISTELRFISGSA